MNYLVILCGHSGSGKSYLEGLLNELPNFFKLSQITTRECRNEADSKLYEFVDVPTYFNKIIKEDYFGRISITNKNNVTNFYGTKIPEELKKNSKENKFFTIVANYDGIEDIYKVLNSRKDLYCKVITCMIDAIGDYPKRIDRTYDYIQKEKELLKQNSFGIDLSFTNNFNKKEFLTANEVYFAISKYLNFENCNQNERKHLMNVKLTFTDKETNETIIKFTQVISKNEKDARYILTNINAIENPNLRLDFIEFL